MNFVISALLVVLAVGNSFTPEEAFENIRKTIPEKNYGIGGLCQANTCCNISSTSSCPLSSMPKDKTTLVLPGGETRCIFGSSTPFAFQVIPGDSDKVVFYFQGGGACWDKYSTEAGLCTTDSSPQSLVGIFDRTSSKNTFRGHTIVNVLYCSGDVFGGDVTREYEHRGEPVVQKGMANVQSALNWVKDQQAHGALSSTLSELVVMGCSAGSVGAQIWGTYVLDALKWKTAAVMPDSYAGVFPEGSQGPLVKAYGFCNAVFLTDALRQKCNAGSLTLQDLDAQSLSSHPNIPMSFIQSKVDIVQQSFYIAIGITMNYTAEITPSQYYEDVNAIFSGYNKYPNFLTYLVDGDQHCFTNQKLFYTADAKGPSDNGASNSGPMMADWVAPYPLSSGDVSKTVCEGNVQSGKASLEDNTYCNAQVYPKTFTQEY